MASIQTGDLSDEKDIRSFLECLSLEKGLMIGSGINRKLHEFKFEIDECLLKEQKIIDMARINTYFDDSIDFIHREDIANCSVTEEGIVVNYNMNPYEKEVLKRPNFVSVVLGYVDKLNVNRYLDFNYEAEFRFVLTNFTNSLKKVFVEFKYSDNNRILETFPFEVEYGKNEISIPLNKMKSKALSNISEICFVIHPDDVMEDEGMFKISELRII